MPGLLGVVSGRAQRSLTAVFDSIQTSMQRDGRFIRERCIDPNGRWALGRLHLGILQPVSQLSSGEQIQVLFHGELSNEAELKKQMRIDSRNHEYECPNTSWVIRDLYLNHGPRFVSELRGAFCAVILDERLEHLILINDYLGSYPLYWFNGRARFVFASELKAILRDPGVKPSLNPRAVADYMAFGFLLGNKTLASQVKLLPPAATLTYSWRHGNCVLESYCSIAGAFQSSGENGSDYLETLRCSFNGAVERSLRGDHKYLVSLSGGLDSRAILSAIDCTRTPVMTYTLGVKGCADEVIARRLSRISGAPNRFLEMNLGYLTQGVDNIREMVSLTDGMYFTHGLTETLASQFLKESDFTVLLRGHGGEFAKTSLAWPLHTDDRIYRMRSKDEFVSYILNRLNYICGDVLFEELFSEDWCGQLRDGARRSLEKSVADVPLSPTNLCSYLYLTGLHRRSTVASLELFRNYVEVRLPFVDEEFLRVLFSGQSRWRDGTSIHRAIIGKKSPALLRVRNSNTGAPGDAGPLAEKLWDKFNSVCKRLNVYGYRHYHSFDRWMKQNLLNSVKQVLLHPRCLSRGMYRENGLRRLIEETRRGVADRAYLLQILLILELWQQEVEGGGE